MITLNSTIAFLLAKHFIKFSEKVLGGSICFTTAMTSLQPSENKAAYGTSKSALNYFSKNSLKRV
ncbi:MAG: SDR family NAD(P)-dependent oxidoreductase [Melioribacteraceae bacterium]|nr:SDR family NAD(P)-dependent oxidoreductase [Melioribacteraceae bacterium]